MSYALIKKKLEEKGYEFRLDDVAVSKKDNSWTLFFTLKNPIAFVRLDEFIKYIKNNVKASSVSETKIRIKYEKMLEIDMLDYWENIINFLSIKRGSISSLSSLKVEYGNNEFKVYVAKGMSYYSIYEELIINTFKCYGFDVKITFIIDESFKTASEIKKETDMKLEQAMRERLMEMEKATSEAVKIDEKANKYRRKKVDVELEVPTKISDIPTDSLGLTDYMNTVGLTNFCIKGQIFGIEVRKMKNTYLAQIKVTDFNDSILIKKWVRGAEEVEAINKLKNGDWIKAYGKAEYDTFSKDVVLMCESLVQTAAIQAEERMDNAVLKRVELHAHSKYSQMDSVVSIKQYLKTALKWGHKAIAITDHDGVYSIAEISHELDKDSPLKPIYGVELTLVDKKDYLIAYNEQDVPLDGVTYVVFDIETTGLSVENDKIIEIGAVKYNGFNKVDTFSIFINPHRKLSDFTMELTHITQEMVDNGLEEKEALENFIDFIGDNSILVGQNVSFDMGHILEGFKRHNINHRLFPVLDTMQMAKALHPTDLKRFNLDALVKFFKVKLDNHHRANEDADATAHVFLHMLEEINAKNIKNYNQINTLIDNNEMFKYVFGYHFNILVQNQIGYKNLFKVISNALTTNFYKGARVLKEDLDKHREGLLIGSGCIRGRVYETALNKSYDELLEVMRYYDYIEVQPPCATSHLLEGITFNQDTILQTTIKKILKAAKELNKIVVATGDVHFLNYDDKKYRDIYVRTKSVGGGLHPLAKVKKTPNQSFLTTDEMLEEFNFLSPTEAFDIVVKNTNKIADMIENIVPFTKTLYTPADDEFKDSLGVPSIVGDLNRMVNEKVHNLYGEELPLIVSERLNKELNSIINNGFSSVYYMSHLLVKKSLSDGYLVGSRGSVGSSFVATMMDITEVNPLSPHYRCPKCKFSSFKMNDDEKKKYGVRENELPLQEILSSVDDGFDLPDCNCPVCGTKLRKDGHDIPFETFLGFKGDKVPDIDLNFSGLYQPTAHEYVRTLMGVDNAFRAGTLATVAEKTAFGYVKGYFEDNNISARNTEIERIASIIEGAKRSTGQHPGGIVVVPKKIDIYDVTPIQYPADDTTNPWRTTHFEYHSFESNLLKLDILGHDDPTVIKFIMDYVREHQDEFPFSDPREIPIDDPKVYKLFEGTEVLGIRPDDIDSDVGSFAVPELGTNFVRQMLTDTKPSTFAELVKISGLSHGTDVWLNNAQELVLGKRNEFGTIPFKDVIGCRDDIMVYLIYQGLEPAKAFEIMEFVRKGQFHKGKKDKWEAHKVYMKEKGIPEWYIWSCEQIQYMFPKAHATAYVLSAMRIAWFKVNYPILFYSAYFSNRADQFDVEVMVHGANAIKNKINEIKNSSSASKTDDDLMSVLYVALEMTRRGMSFKMVDITKSEATKFVIDGNSLLCPFVCIDGLGLTVAAGIVEERNKEPFSSKADVLSRCKLNKNHVEKMQAYGSFSLLSESIDAKEGKEKGKMTLFDL